MAGEHARECMYAALVSSFCLFSPYTTACAQHLMTNNSRSSEGSVLRGAHLHCIALHAQWRTAFQGKEGGI